MYRWIRIGHDTFEFWVTSGILSLMGKIVRDVECKRWYVTMKKN